jgi:4'-phosphopantetheinyl transferase EntD
MGLLRVLPAAVLPGPRGEPQWPRGVVGSITHCRGYRGAVLGRASQIAAIGIDAEPNEPLPDGVLSAIGSAEEFAWIDRLLAQEPDVRWDRLLFCMKEAVYKAWFPLAHCWLDFDAVVITVDVANTEFTAWLQIPGPTVHGRVLDRFTGRWQVLDGLILATIVLPVAGTCEPRDQVPEDGRRAGQEPANPSTPSRPAG